MKDEAEFEEAVVELCHAYQRWHDEGDREQAGWLDARARVLALYRAKQGAE